MMTGTMAAAADPEAQHGGTRPRGDAVRPDRDADLVALLRAQAPGAVETLVARYGALLYRLAVGITGDPEDAEEVVQDALWAAVSRIDTFRHRSAFGSWLYRVAANAAYGARRRRRHDLPWDEARPGVTEYGQELAPLTDRSADTERRAVQAELRRALAAAVDDLPAGHRAAFWLREVEGLSNVETARTLGLSLPAMKSRLHRSRLCLRKRLAGYLTADPPPASPARGADRILEKPHDRECRGPRGPEGGKR